MTRTVDGTSSDEGQGMERGFYELPRHLTQSGRIAFDREMQKHAQDVGDQLGRVSESPVIHGEDPEYTADTVAKAVVRCLGQRSAAAADRRNVNLQTCAAILITLAQIGVPVMQGFLHEWWHYAFYVVLLALGAVGLVLVWVSRQRSLHR